jgi:3D (Asp-Asp-Asp) domain-containing protein
MEPLKRNYKRIISIKLAKKVVLSILFSIFWEFLLAASPVMASNSNNINNNSETLGISTNIGNGNIIIEDEQITQVSQEDLEQPAIEEKTTIINKTPVTTDKDKKTLINKLPENSIRQVKDVMGYRHITAYNSEVGQTDDDPCTTANGFNLCSHGQEDSVAANFLKFGTKIRIPELFGNKVFVVRDRMNPRFGDRVDVWMLHKNDALKFGVQVAKIEVVE